MRHCLSPPACVSLPCPPLSHPLTASRCPTFTSSSTPLTPSCCSPCPAQHPPLPPSPDTFPAAFPPLPCPTPVADAFSLLDNTPGGTPRLTLTENLAPHFRRGKQLYSYNTTQSH
ncbi:uncharacterized protein LOC135101764 [Scylla paramamosain]|uniref:uncharacterized protein LOC135101764 n=1 Tax=Scylla paramamosain TaxID=85552 RepID=UPI003082A411